MLDFLLLLFLFTPALESSWTWPFVVIGMSESAAVGGLSAPLNGEEMRVSERTGESRRGLGTHAALVLASLTLRLGRFEGILADTSERVRESSILAGEEGEVYFDSE